MNFKNKLFAAFTAVSVVAMSAAPIANVSVFANNEEDMSAYEWAFDKGLTTMTTFNAFMFENAITREQAARFLTEGSKALAIDLSSDQTCDYKDLAGADQTLVPFINEGCKMGIFKAQANFNPKALLTREQAELTVARIVYGFDEVADYAKEEKTTDYAAARELLMADEIVKFNIAPQSAVKRGHLLLMLYRLNDSDVVSPTTPVVKGHAEVSLVSAAATQNVPYNAAAVKVGTIKLTAGKDGAKVSSVVVSREGLGNANDIAGVWLANTSVVTDARTFSSSSQTANVRFSPALTLTAGQSMTFDVMVALNASASTNSNHTFKVTSVNVSNGTAAGTPITLGTINTTSYKVGEVTATLFGQSVSSGKTNQLFAKVDLSSTQASTVKGFVLTRTDGKDLNKVIANAKAYHNGNVIGNVVVTDDKVIVSDLNLDRLASETASIEIKGDAIYVGPATTVKLQLKKDNASINVVEKASSYAMPLSADSNLVDVTLSALNLTITKTTTGTVTVAPGTNSVVLYAATIKSDAEFDVTKFTLDSVGDDFTTAGKFADQKVTLYVDGVDFDVNATTKTRGNSDRFTVEPGREVVVKVVGNVLSTATAGDYRFKFTINDVKNNTENTTIVGLDKYLQGDKVSVKKGSATIKNATVAAPVAKTVYAGNAQEIGRFAVKGDAENVTLRKLTVKNTGNADLTTVVNGNDVKLINVATNNEVSASVTVNADNVVFDGMSEVIAKDAEVNFKVVAFTSNFDSTLHGKTIKLKLDHADVTADRASGGTATVTGDATAKEYALGIQPPVVTLSKIDADTFRLTVKNVDAESPLTLNKVGTRVRILAADADYVGKFCLIPEGSAINNCTATGVSSTNVGAIPGAVADLTLATPVEIAKNGGSVSYDILVESNFINPAVLRAEISSLDYGTVENYDVSAQ